ncbi:MAG TPA: glutamate--tRNA ligase [Sandaracinaceae bacterium LLY-WYZ-13_1]|nr:glutamate--tRNA ligase [Sandaracinaceae bacterium LLY-WYZ-13_1]
MSVRVRFAPSPTGYLHIGGARTALYNWLWARKQGGTFVLRVEDTDRARSTEASVQAIFDALRWLGLDWDEGPEVGGDHGPYFQTERLATYREHAERLVASGHAYRCYATKEELDAARKEYEEKTGKKGWRYPGWWRDKSPEDWPAGEPFVYRIKVPREGKTGWDDLVKGRVEFEHAQLQDDVLLRSDGVPLYNFGCVVDDLTMGITLVARGDDHLINTPTQLLLYRALGEEPPQFAHLPMILDERGKKMSKRDDAGSVEIYRERGFVPDAVLNYLARLGWSHGDQELFTREELIEAFDWGSVGKEGARYDEKKFISVQAHHLRELPGEELAARALPFAEARGLSIDPDDPRLVPAVETVRQRAQTLADVALMIDYYFRDPPEQDEKAARKFLKPKFLEPLKKLRALIAAQEAFDRASLETAVKAWMEENELGFKHYAQAVRVSLSGRSATPGLFEVMEVLGKERCVERLDAGIAQIEARAAEAGT